MVATLCCVYTSRVVHRMCADWIQQVANHSGCYAVVLLKNLVQWELATQSVGLGQSLNGHHLTHPSEL